MSIRRCFAIVCAMVAMNAAAQLPVTSTLVQPAGQPLETSIGMPVFKVTRTSPLPNAFGKADIFGRTVDRGSVELRYQGQTPDGKLVFRLVDFDVRSNETTMNRTPMNYSSGSATANTTGSTTSVRGNSYTIRGQEGRNETLPPNTTEFAIDPEKKRELRIGSVTIKILDFDETSLRYSLSSEAKE